ncbi:hypothetical protein TRVL_01328 [Trypanosoma vivax]|nr:hypothetical protein TRVL_01328 [Trypanosoma vivax]
MKMKSCGGVKKFQLLSYQCEPYERRDSRYRLTRPASLVGVMRRELTVEHASLSSKGWWYMRQIQRVLFAAQHNNTKKQKKKKRAQAQAKPARLLLLEKPRFVTLGIKLCQVLNCFLVGFHPP